MKRELGIFVLAIVSLIALWLVSPSSGVGQGNSGLLFEKAQATKSDTTLAPLIIANAKPDGIRRSTPDVDINDLEEFSVSGGGFGGSSSLDLPAAAKGMLVLPSANADDETEDSFLDLSAESSDSYAPDDVADDEMSWGWLADEVAESERDAQIQRESIRKNDTIGDAWGVYSGRETERRNVFDDRESQSWRRSERRISFDDEW